MKLNWSHINTATPEEPEASILIIYTGGTIGMVLDQSKSLIPFDFELIMNHVPTLKRFNLNLDVVSFSEPVDSSNISPMHWKLIAETIRDNYDDHDGFIILHGTDTMAYSASALSFMLEGLSKPVIFTGAQLPVSSPRSDAPENLITSIEVAAGYKTGGVLVPEVCIYFDYMLLRGNRSKKVESQHFNAFRTGNYPALAEAGISIEYNENYIRKLPDMKFSVSTAMSQDVVGLKLFPGMNRRVVEAVTEIEGLRGIVLETYGSGNGPTGPELINPLKKATEKGIVVVNVSQCVGGMVVQGIYETSRLFNEIGIIGGGDMTSEAAVTKLMYLLGKDIGAENMRIQLSKNLRGEMEDRK